MNTRTGNSQRDQFPYNKTVMIRRDELDSPIGSAAPSSNCSQLQMEECEPCPCGNRIRELGFIHLLEATWLLVQGCSIEHEKTTLHNHTDHEATE